MHDTKKHYFYIEECVKKGNYDVIEDYLKKSMEDIEQSYNRINTGNLVIDAFVSNHMSIAEKENIEFRTDIQVSLSNIQIDDYDFSIILGNLLDNCLNAVKFKCRLRDKLKYPSVPLVKSFYCTFQIPCLIKQKNMKKMKCYTDTESQMWKTLR